MKDFEWFLTLLTQLELEESREREFDRFLDMHLYITSAKSKTDLKGVGLQMALELIHQKEQRDLLTGLKTRTQPGRPNWNQVFVAISIQIKLILDWMSRILGLTQGTNWVVLVTIII